VKLNDCVAVVTGAASGIGRALCPLLGRKGARLVLVDRDCAGLDSLGAELADANIPFAAATVDVRQRAALGQAIRSSAADLGPVDLLVACAGITGVTLVDDLDVEQIEALMRVNFLGVAYAIDAVLPEMLQRRRGQIVGVSSLAGCRGMPFSAGYSASKAALATFLEGLRPALRRRGIAVTTCYLGFVRTPLSEALPLHPKLWKISPEYAANRILDAVVRKRREAYFPWYDACGAKFLRRLPAWAFDAVMATFGPILAKGEY
jgi:short-subunit dehydrogenase